MTGRKVTFAFIALVLFGVALGALWNLYRLFHGDIDVELTAAGWKKTVGDLLIVPGLVDSMRASPSLQISLVAMPAGTVTLNPSGGAVITTEFLAFRRQYEMRLWNESEDTISHIKLRLQSPYPIEFSELAGEAAIDPSFSPMGGFTVSVSGAGAGVSMPRMITPVWEFKATEIRPGGSVTVKFIVNSKRDPRGQAIPESERARYSIPDVGPKVTYIDGDFLVGVADRTKAIKRHYYAPFSLADRTLQLGRATKPPHTLLQIEAAYTVIP
jgi:hypothetical protein